MKMIDHGEQEMNIGVAISPANTDEVSNELRAQPNTFKNS